MNLPYVVGKNHHSSKYGNIERCLKIMKSSGRKTFTATDVEKATGTRHMVVMGILRFTEGVDHIERPKTCRKEAIWYFTEDEILVPVSRQISRQNV